ncbi:MAG: glycosyltransferase, partial [Intestinibacter sp.]|uniref:glycosyltransferase n=1 Tax=Intestinibacter sp. TaxID=1965304 RepID=UPI0025BE550D
MKVLLVNKFHYKKGGSETYYFTIGEALKVLGHEVVYFAMKDDKNIPCEQEEFFIDNVDYNGDVGAIEKVKSALSIVYKKESKEKITELIKKEKPDLAILNLVHRQITLSIVDALKEFDIPIFFTMHDLICVCPNYTMLSSDGIC